MKNTHLSRLLSTLTSKELKLLKKWVGSPFFNQRKDVIQLLDYYLFYRKKYKKLPTKAEIFNHLFPDEAFEDHKIRMVISFLNKQTEQFLIYQKQQTKKIANKLDLLAIYGERKLAKPHNRVSREIEKIFEQTALKNAQYYRLKYHFHQEQFKAEEVTKRLQRKNSLQAIADTLDISFLIEKIRESTIVYAHQRITTVKYDLGVFEYLVTIINEKPRYLENPAIATYYAAYLTILHPVNDAYFNNYRHLLEKNESIFNKIELLELYTIATVYLNGRYNRGETNYVVDSFAIYKRQLELDLYEHKMAHYAFKNIAITGLKNKAYDWVEQFIEDYSPKLVEEQRTSLSNWARGSLARRRGQHEKALELLQAIKFEDALHNMSARLTIAKIYYELGKWEVLQNHLKAFEIYVRRFRKSGIIKEGYLEFTLVAQKIFRLNPYDKKEQAQLLKTLKTNTKILEREWLLNCLNNIEFTPNK